MMLAPRCTKLRPAAAAAVAAPTDTTPAIAAARVRVVTTTTIAIIPATRAQDMGPMLLVVAAGEEIAIRRSPFVTYLRARRFTNFLVNENKKAVCFLFDFEVMPFGCCFWLTFILLFKLCCNPDAHDTFVFASAAAELTTHKQRHRYANIDNIIII